MAMKEINVLDSAEHSALIYVLNTKKMYASEIARLLREQQPTIQRRLLKLKRAGFVGIKEHPQKINNVKLFYLNWNKVLNEFFKLLKEHKNEFVEMHKNLKTNIKPERLALLNLLEDKTFIQNLKDNKYLKKALTEYFTTISKTKKCSLSSALGYFTFFGDFEFIYATHPSIYQVITQNDLRKQLEQIDSKQQKQIPESESEFEKFKKEQREFTDNLQKRQNAHDSKIEEIKQKDKDLKVILQFNEIKRILGMDLGLQLALNDAIELTAYSVLYNHFPKELIDNYRENLFFKYSRRYKGVSEELKQNVREKIDKNGMNAPKPKTTKRKKVNQK